jgi:hypothetical protein
MVCCGAIVEGIWMRIWVGVCAVEPDTWVECQSAEGKRDGEDA